MQDSYVVGLRYKVTHLSNVDFKAAPPVTWDGPDFTVTLQDEEAKVELKGNFRSVTEARGTVEPFMRAWTVLAEVDGDPGMFALEYKDAVVEDRNPSEGRGSSTLRVQSTHHAHAADHITLHVSHGKYPEVPAQFRVDAAVEAMHLHYRRYREGSEPLPMAAYFCLTALEMKYGAGHRGRAATNLHVSQRVMQTLGRLASSITGPDARKYCSYRPAMDSVGNKERRWLLAAVRLLIRRAGECVATSPSELPKITMAELPDLR